jgi:hypothetical protein
VTLVTWTTNDYPHTNLQYVREQILTGCDVSGVRGPAPVTSAMIPNQIASMGKARCCKEPS